MEQKERCSWCKNEREVKNYVFTTDYAGAVGIEKGDGISLCSYCSGKLGDNIRLSKIYLK